MSQPEEDALSQTGSRNAIPTLLESMGMTQEDLDEAIRRGETDPNSLKELVDECDGVHGEEKPLSREELRFKLKSRIKNMEETRQRTGKHSLPPAKRREPSSSNTPSTSSDDPNIPVTQSSQDFIRNLKKHGVDKAIEELNIDDQELKKLIKAQLKGVNARALNPVIIREGLKRAMAHRQMMPTETLPREN